MLDSCKFKQGEIDYLEDIGLCKVGEGVVSKGAFGA